LEKYKLFLNVAIFFDLIVARNFNMPVLRKKYESDFEAGLRQSAGGRPAYMDFCCKQQPPNESTLFSTLSSGKWKATEGIHITLKGPNDM